MHRPKPCNLADKQWHGFTENINRVSEKYDTQNIKTTDHRLIMAVEFHRIKQTIKKHTEVCANIGAKNNSG